MDAHAADTKLSNMTPWLEINSDEASQVMEMPVGYSGRRNTALRRPKDLGCQIGFLV